MIVCTKEIYRPQRDSNPVTPGSESTTLPGAMYDSDFKLRVLDDLTALQSHKAVYVYFASIRVYCILALDQSSCINA